MTKAVDTAMDTTGVVDNEQDAKLRRAEAIVNKERQLGALEVARQEVRIKELMAEGRSEDEAWAELANRGEVPF